MGYYSVDSMMTRVGWVAWTALLFCAGAAPQQPPPRSGAPIGPLGHWKGDDGPPPAAAVDSTGNGYKGSYSAGATVSTEVPKTKFANTGSFNLDGATGMITIPDAPELRITGDFTVAFWKRKTAVVKDWVRIVGKGNGAQRNFGIWEYPENSGQIKCQMYGPGGQSVLELDSPAGTPMNTWTHIVFTVSVNSAALYLDGKLVGNAMRTGEPGTAADPLTFGHAGYHGFFPGQIDDVRIYNRALSMGEVVYLAQGNGLPEPPTGLVATSVGSEQLTLKWTATATAPPAGTLTYYTVKRSTTAGSSHSTVAWGLTGTSSIDLRPDSKTTYYYVVTAINSAGESVASNEVTVAPHPQ
jgi:hypothetical protein